MKNPVFPSLALLLLALFAISPALFPLDGLALLPALFFRLLPRKRWGVVLRLLWFSGVLVLAGLSYGWLSGHTIRLALMLALILKWAEADSPAEFAFLSPALLVAGASGIFQWGEWASLLLMGFFLLLSLGVLEGSANARLGFSGIRASEKAPWAVFFNAGFVLNLKRIALALPLAAVLFVFFPRIPGPLWDIGLTLGLPLPMGIDQSHQGLGVATRLKPGQGAVKSGAGENEPVLVAEFENWVPPTALLYWRGPVYYDFDGSQWSLDVEYEEGQGRLLMRRGWVKGADFSATLAKKGHEIAYLTRLTPHKRLWLYGLDMPTMLAAESFISTDWQVLAHRPVTAETSYRLKSALDWEAGGILDEALRNRALALPKAGNPRLREAGQKLSALPPDERPRAVLAALSKEGYRVLDNFEFQDGENALDAFWFDQREGNADLYAGTFVFLMRAANIPARLVTGYRGGKLMALTDYVIVKKNHAHAWVEIWNEAKGWQRIDPVDLIAPERFSGIQEAKAVKPRQNIKISQPEAVKAAPASQSASVTQKASGASEGLGFRLPEWENFLSRWVFRLDGQTQQNLLNELSGKGKNTDKPSGGKFAWVWLLAAAAFAALLVVLSGFLMERWRKYRRIPFPERVWKQSTRLLARRGLALQAWECPVNFAYRVGAAKPLWAKTIHAMAFAYGQWRYAKDKTKAQKQLKEAARKLHNLILADVDALRNIKPPQSPKPPVL